MDYIYGGGGKEGGIIKEEKIGERRLFPSPQAFLQVSMVQSRVLHFPWNSDPKDGEEER